MGSELGRRLTAWIDSESENGKSEFMDYEIKFKIIQIEDNIYNERRVKQITEQTKTKGAQ